MEEHFEGKAEAETRKRAIRTQKTIVVVMVVLAVLPLLIAWITGSLRF